MTSELRILSQLSSLLPGFYNVETRGSLFLAAKPTHFCDSRKKLKESYRTSSREILQDHWDAFSKKSSPAAIHPADLPCVAYRFLHCGTYKIVPFLAIPAPKIPVGSLLANLKETLAPDRFPHSNLKNSSILNSKTITVHGSYIIDVNDVNALVGDADYVFVGKVLKQNGVKDVTDTTEMAYTQYQIQVIENIKGSLITDQPIEIEKAGGYSEKEQVNYLYEDDFLPEKDEICIFYAYAQPDGSLEVSGPNSNIKLNSNEKTGSARSYQDEEKYQEVVDALDSQIIRERDRSVSKYEKK